MSDNHTLLEGFAVSPLNSQRHEGNAPKPMKLPDVSDFIQVPAVRDWFLSREVSNGAIEDVINHLHADAEKITSLQDHLVNLFPETQDAPSSEYISQRLVLALSNDIKHDLEQNDGRMFKTIMLNAQEVALAKILGNNQLKDWLYRNGEEKMTVYDVEETAVKATVILMAETYTNILQRTPGKTELN